MQNRPYFITYVNRAHTLHGQPLSSLFSYSRGLDVPQLPEHDETGIGINSLGSDDPQLLPQLLHPVFIFRGSLVLQLLPQLPAKEFENCFVPFHPANALKPFILSYIKLVLLKTLTF
ncbi:MAG: hypothetical protein ACRDDZ_13590 [Marinifilaceae bacterium]